MDEANVYMARPNARKTFSRIALTLFISFVCARFLAYLLDILLRDTAFYARPLCTYLITSAPMYIVSIPIMLLMLRGLPVPEYQKTAVSPRQLIMLLPVSFAVCYAFNLITAALTGVISLIKGSDIMNPVNEIASAYPLPMLLIVTGVIAPVLEEYMFRKLVLDRLRPFGDLCAIVFSGVCFGLFHGNLSQFLYAAALGMLFGYVAIRTGKIYYTMIMHAFVNLLGTLSAYIVAADNMLLTAAYGYIVLGLVVCGAILFFTRFKKRLYLAPAAEGLAAPATGRDMFLNVGMLLYIAAFLAAAVIYIVI